MVAAQVQFAQRDFESAMISLNCVNTLASENGVLSKVRGIVHSIEHMISLL